MRAFLLAGGLGTRLRVLFPNTPKALVTFAGQPIVAHEIAQLAHHGIDDIVLCVGRDGEAIRERLGDGRPLGVRLRYSFERRPLGTAGALRHARRLFTTTAAVLNGDTYLPLDWTAMRLYHEAHPGTVATLAAVWVTDVSRYGRLRVDREDRIVDYHEKGVGSGPGLVSAGCYVLEPAVLDEVPRRGAVSLETEVFPRLVASGRPVRAFRAPGPFVDMGTPEGYQALCELLG